MRIEIGSVITASTIAPSILGVYIEEQKVTSIMTYDEALKIKPEIPYTNTSVYLSIHVVNTPDVTKMLFVKFENGDLIAMDWLKVDSIKVISSIPLLRINIVNGTQVLVDTLNTLFPIAGILNYNITLLQDGATKVLLVRIEISYLNDLLKTKAIEVIRDANINEFTFEVIK